MDTNARKHPRFSPHPRRRAAFIVATCLSLCAASSACDDAEVDEDTGDAAGDMGDGDGEFDDTEVEVAMAAFPDGFTMINDAPFETQGHSQAFDVNVWVQDPGVDAYASVDPDITGSMPAIDAGLIIVKEQFDGADAVTGYTIMAKGPDGFDLDGGDWWWGFADANRALTNTSTNGGDVSFCVSCHAVRPEDDWLYGVATDNRR